MILGEVQLASNGEEVAEEMGLGEALRGRSGSKDAKILRNCRLSLS